MNLVDTGTGSNPVHPDMNLGFFVGLKYELAFNAR